MAGVDVVITNYQYGHFLLDAANSVLRQNVPGLRLLIIDNASTDDSQNVAKRIACQDDRVTLFLNEANKGYHDSFNRGIEWAQAEYLVFLDADDLSVPGALARGMSLLSKRQDVAFAHGLEGRLLGAHLDPARSDPSRTRWSIVDGARFIRRTCYDSFCAVGAPTVIRRTSAQKRAGWYRPELVRASDFEMYLRLAMLGGVACTNRLQGIRRIHSDQQSTLYMTHPVRDFEAHEDAFLSFFRHEGSSLPDAERLCHRARRKLGDHAYWYALWQFLSARPGYADTFAYATARRSRSALAPPLTFLCKQRWLRSLYRVMRRAMSQPTPYPPASSHGGRVGQKTYSRG